MMDPNVEVVLVARNPEIADWVQQCADKKLDFGELCKRVAAMGFKTTSLFEMVVAAQKGK
jgi:hypothetical protein